MKPNMRWSVSRHSARHARARYGLPMTQVVGIVVLSAVFLGERDIFTVRMVIGCAHLLGFA